MFLYQIMRQVSVTLALTIDCSLFGIHRQVRKRVAGVIAFLSKLRWNQKELLSADNSLVLSSRVCCVWN